MDEPLTTNDRLTRLEGEVSALKVGQAQLGADVRQVLDRLSNSGKTNWALIFAGLGVLVTIFLPSIALLGVFMTLQIQSSVAPLSAKAEVSIRDRGELHESHRLLTELVTEINSRERETTASQKAALVEVESQFSASDHVRNLQNANLTRYVALLWERVYGQRFPSDINYFPNISQHER